MITKFFELVQGLLIFGVVLLAVVLLLLYLFQNKILYLPGKN